MVTGLLVMASTMPHLPRSSSASWTRHLNGWHPEMSVPLIILFVTERNRP